MSDDDRSDESIRDEFNKRVPDSFHGSDAANPGRPQFLWAVFPPWGEWGQLIEYRPPSKHNKWPYVMVQQILKRGPTFVKQKKPLTAYQKDTGQQVPTLTLSFDSLPIFINALNEVWMTWRREDGNDEVAGTVRPDAKESLAEYKRMAEGRQAARAVNQMGEFGGKGKGKKTGGKGKDVWGELKDAIAGEKGAAKDEAPICQSQSGDPGPSDPEGGEDTALDDELAAFAEFGGGGKRGEDPPF